MKLSQQVKKDATAHLGKHLQHQSSGCTVSGLRKRLGVISWKNGFARKTSSVPSGLHRQLHRGKMRHAAVPSRWRSDEDRCFSSSTRWMLR